MDRHNASPGQGNGEAGASDLSISIARASLVTLLISVPLSALMAGVLAFSALRRGGELEIIRPLDVLAFVIALILGIFAHEGLHALGWAWFGRQALRSMRFGFEARTLTPYAHATEPMAAHAYRWGSVLPAIVLGLLPFAVGTALGRAGLSVFGIAMTFAAGGDLLVLWLIRGVDADDLVQDPPSRVGCMVLGRRSS